MSAKFEASKLFAETDLAWGFELQRQFGKRCGDVRYTPRGKGEPGSTLHQLYAARMQAMRAWETIAFGEVQA